MPFGSGAFAAATLRNGKSVFTLPLGIERFAIAYIRPDVARHIEAVVEASFQDGANYTVSCLVQQRAISGTVQSMRCVSRVTHKASNQIIAPAKKQREIKINPTQNRTRSRKRI